MILASELTSDELLSIMDAYPKWQAGKEITEDDAGNLTWEGKPYKTLYLRYEGKLYKVNSAHNTQSDWLPGVAHSLYSEVTPPSVVGPWKQPQGVHDSYKMGDFVTHNDRLWECTQVDQNGNNAHEPGVWGWTDRGTA